MKNIKKNFGPLLLWILLAEGAGLIGSVFTAPAIPIWYAGLIKPELAPPNWVFGPVWTTLFLLMGIAAFLVWRRPVSKQRTFALTIFYVQLFLNVLWSFLFFGKHNPGAALFEIGVLWVAIATTIWAFARVSKRAAWLLVPYLLWVSFASYLNFALWTLNR